MTIAITVAYGEEPGPELLEAALHVLREAGAALTVDSIEIGKRIYAMDYPLGVLPASFQTLDHSRMLLMGPVTTPQGERYKHPGEVIREYYGLTEEHKLSGTLAGSHGATAYINDQFALFTPQEPTLASTLFTCIFLLEHIGQHEVGDNIREALEMTLSEGVEPQPLMQRLLGTAQSEPMHMAEALCARLGAKNL